MLSNNQKRENNYYWLRQTYVDGIPADCKGVYYKLLNQVVAYNKNLIKDVIDTSGGELSFPMETMLLQEYMTGWNIQYIGYEGSIFDTYSGYWEQDNEDDSVVYIYYSLNDSAKRQRYTKVHETFHFMQSVDVKMLDFFDTLVSNTTLPAGVVVKLMEKATDKATAMYLMPNKYFYDKWREMQSISALSEFFQVSEQSVAYRMKECQVPINLN